MRTVVEDSVREQRMNPFICISISNGKRLNVRVVDSTTEMFVVQAGILCYRIHGVMGILFNL